MGYFLLLNKEIHLLKNHRQSVSEHQKRMRNGTSDERQIKNKADQAAF